MTLITLCAAYAGGEKELQFVKAPGGHDVLVRSYPAHRRFVHIDCNGYLVQVVSDGFSEWPIEIADEVVAGVEEL